MYEWLQEELSTIKTPRFHVVDGPADERLRDAVVHSPLPLPSSYKEFVLKFGNAKFYRVSRIGYTVGVFAGPRQAMLDDATFIYHIGWNDGASVYVKTASTRVESPIFEYEEEEVVAGDFAEWLSNSCALARRKYGKRKWAEISRGPDPFSAREEQILQARRKIQWRVIGISAAGDHLFEIANGSDRKLPVLLVGLRSRDGRLNGEARLNIGHIGPGQMGVVSAPCYKSLRSSHDIEPFPLPEPQPEDRDFYCLECT